MREATCTRAQSPCSLADSWDLIASHFLKRALSSCSALHRFAVCSSVERNEEQKVGGEDADASDGSKLLTGALAGVGEPVPVCRSEVGPGRKVDEA